MAVADYYRTDTRYRRAMSWWLRETRANGICNSDWILHHGRSGLWLLDEEVPIGEAPDWYCGEPYRENVIVLGVERFFLEAPFLPYHGSWTSITNLAPALVRAFATEMQGTVDRGDMEGRFYLVDLQGNSFRAKRLASTLVNAGAGPTEVTLTIPGIGNAVDRRFLEHEIRGYLDTPWP